MRILYLNPSGQLGGAETSLLTLLDGVRSCWPEWEVHLLLGEEGPLVAKAEKLGVRTEVIPFPAALARTGDSASSLLLSAWRLSQATRSALLYRKRLATTIRRLRPDLIHSNGFKMHLLGAWVAGAEVPVIWHIHDYVSRRPWMSRILRRLRHRSKAAIVNSRSVEVDVRSNLPGLATRTIYNAIDLKKFSPSGPVLDLDRLAGFPPGRPDLVRVGLVGTFARWKGHEVFLRALSQLPRDLPVRAFIIGAPIYQTSGSQWSFSELQAEARRLSLDGRIGFTGFLDDTASAMRALDIVVHASTLPEPFGMVIVEGMACAKAVVVSNAGGAAELIDDGFTALSHHPGDAAELSRAIERLTRDPGLRVRLGSNGRVAAERLCDSTRLTREVLATYAECQHSTARGGASFAPLAR